MTRKAQSAQRGRRGHGYPVLPTWQEDVKAALAKRKITEKQFAKIVKCSQSTMHDTLNKPDAKHSSLVPDIHAALGWDPPAAPQGESPPLPSPDAIEMAHMFDRLPEHIKKQLRDQAATYLGID